MLRYFLNTFFISLIFQIRIICLIRKNLNFETFTQRNSAPGSHDSLHSLVTKSNEIIFGGTSCSYIGTKCLVILQKFSNDFNFNFNLQYQNQLEAYSSDEIASSIIEGTDGSLIINAMINLKNNNYLIFYKFSPFFILEQTLTHYKKGNPGITSLFNIIEIGVSQDLFYRSYFGYRDVNLNNKNKQTCYSIDINSNFNSNLESLEIIETNSQQYYSENILFFKKIGSFFYHSGYCIKQIEVDVSFAYFCKFDLLWNKQCYVNVTGSYYTSLLQINAQTIYVKRGNDFYESFLDIFSIDGNNINFENEKQISFLTTYTIKDTTQSIMINDFCYTVSRCYEPYNSSILYRINLTTNALTYTGEIISQFPSYYLSSSEYVLGKFFPSSIYQLNSTHLLSTGNGMFQSNNYDFLASFIDLNNPTLNDTIVFGGSGNYLSTSIIQCNSTTLLIYGKDGVGLYFVWINSQDHAIKKESKFKFGYSITTASVIMIENGTSIIIGNVKKQKNEPFIASIDSLFYIKKTQSPNWISNFIPIHAITFDTNYFIIAGTFTDTNGIQLCTYFKVHSFDLNQAKIYSIHLEGNLACQINFILLSTSNHLYGVGELLEDHSGIIFGFDETPQYQIINNKKLISLITLIEINSTMYIAGGLIKIKIKIETGENIFPYFIQFNNNLDLITDLSINKMQVSHISNFQKLTDSILGCILGYTDIPQFVFIFVDSLKKEDKIVIHNNPNSGSNPFWALHKYSNDTFYSYGSEGLSSVSKKNSLLFVKSILSPNCHKGEIFNFNNYNCSTDCGDDFAISEYKCLEFIGDSCVNCLLNNNSKKEKYFDHFSENEFVCSSFVAINIVNDSVNLNLNLDKDEISLEFNFNQQIKYLENKINLFLYISDNIQIPLKYEKLNITKKNFLISHIKFPSTPIFNYIKIKIKIDLRNLNITNNCGNSFNNSVFTTDSDLLNSGNSENFGSGITKSISNFITNYQYLLIRNTISIALIGFGFSSGLINMNLGSLVGIAEITQFLALFQLLSLRFFPNDLTLLYISQSVFNFNFNLNIIDINDFPFLPCNDMKTEDILEYNIAKHPSYNCILAYCNLVSTFILVLFCHSLYIITILLTNKLSFKWRSNLLWGSFLSLLLSDFINIIVILVLQIIFVL